MKVDYYEDCDEMFDQESGINDKKILDADLLEIENEIKLSERMDNVKLMS